MRRRIGKPRFRSGELSPVDIEEHLFNNRALARLLVSIYRQSAGRRYVERRKRWNSRD